MTGERGKKWLSSQWWIIGFVAVVTARLNGSTTGTVDPNGVVITRLTVPHSIENGTAEYADLDCEYTLRDNITTILEVTWHHRELNQDKESIVYKWVPDAQIRRASGILENRLDFDYSVSSVPWERYRALRILRPTTEISGTFRCDVSTVDGHKTEWSMLIVYSKPKEYNLEVSPATEDATVNISCFATRTYPAAKLSISYEKNKSYVKLTELNEESDQAAGAFDVKVFSTVDRNVLPASTKIGCDIKIPNTSYLERKEVAYKGSEAEDNNSASTLSLGGGFLVLLHFLKNIILLTLQC